MLLLTALGFPWQLPSAHAPTSLTAAALGPFVAFLAHTGQDWDWELPAVTVPCRMRGRALAPTRRTLLGRVPKLVGGAAALALVVLALTAYAGNRELALAEAGSERPLAGLRACNPGRRSPSVRGEAQLLAGRELAAARASFREGLSRDDGDWELWIDLALASEGDARRSAFDRAVRLNPRDPDLPELRQE